MPIDRFILDSSIWIELERGNEKIIEFCRPLFATGRVDIVDLIVAEVLRGTKTKKSYQTLESHFQNFRILSTDWISVAGLAFQVARRGFYPPLSDLYIARCTISERSKLVTQDNDFKQIQKVYPFDLILI